MNNNFTFPETPLTKAAAALTEHASKDTGTPLVVTIGCAGFSAAEFAGLLAAADAFCETASRCKTGNIEVELLAAAIRDALEKQWENRKPAKQR